MSAGDKMRPGPYDRWVEKNIMNTPTPTALQLQKLLNHAAAGILEEDGIWGPNSQEVWDFWTGTPETGTEFDERTERNLATLLPEVQDSFRNLLRIARTVGSDFDVEVKAIGGTRTWEEQDALYAKGRTERGPKVTNAKGGYSNHNYGIAIDLGCFRGGIYLDGDDTVDSQQTCAIIYRSIALQVAPEIEWGGDWTSFKDEPHFQYRTGLTMAQMRQRVAAGESIV